MRAIRAVMLIGVLAACSDDITSPPLPTAPSLAKSHGVVGSVYTASNAAAGNEVLAFARAADGSLSPIGAFPTGGLGSGGGLGNQGGIVLDESGRTLLVVNAGSDEVSSFRVSHDGTLSLLSTVSSGGSMPISVTVSRNLVYVLNAGGDGNIVGFELSPNGMLSMIPGSARPLSSTASGPAQISFDPRGRRLVVTEKATNLISTYTVANSGLATGPFTTASAGPTPFGFGFTNSGTLIVSEAFGGGVDASAVSSYDAAGGAMWNVISASVATTETAACWIVVTNNGKFAYTTNTGSGSITGYRVKHNGLTLLDADGVTGVTGPGSGPIDMALARNSKFLYTLASGTNEIVAMSVGAKGSLDNIGGGISGLPASTNGLAAR